MGPLYGSPLWFWELFINNIMLRFKQYLIERAIDTMPSWYDPDFPPESSSKKETDKELDARRAREDEQYRLMTRATRYKGAYPSEHRIDTDLPADLQQLQQSNRKASFEAQGLVAPHPEVTKQTSVGVYSPRLSDLEELERLGVVDAKNYRTDERGILYRPGSLPSEAQRASTAHKATDVANVGGGLATANTPEAKQQRSDAIRDYYTKTGKYVGRSPDTRIPKYGSGFSERQLGIDMTYRPFDSGKSTVSKVTDAAKNLGAAGLAAAGSIAGSALTQGVQAATDVMGMVGTTPTGKDRMQIEKSFNSDMGLGFDLGPDGELVMNPAGREAARKRQQSGINFPSMFQK